MNDSRIYLIETDSQENIISTYSKHLKYFFNQSLNDFNLVTVKPKDNLDMPLIDLLCLETIELSLSKNSENNLLNSIDQLKNPYINDLLDYLPDLKMRFKDLNYDQKIVFSFIKSILRNHECILIEKIDSHLSADVFNTIKSAITHQTKNYNNIYFILSDRPEYWLDICDKYFVIKDEESKLLTNLVKSNYINQESKVVSL